MSVNLGRLSSVQATLSGYPEHGLVAITVQLCRDADQEVEYQPVPGNPAHCVVIGKKRRGAVRRKFKEGAVILVMPP